MARLKAYQTETELEAPAFKSVPVASFMATDNADTPLSESES